MSGYKVCEFPRVIRVRKNGGETVRHLDPMAHRGDDIETQRRIARLDLALGIYREIRIETLVSGEVVAEVVR